MMYTRYVKTCLLYVLDVNEGKERKNLLWVSFN